MAESKDLSGPYHHHLLLAREVSLSRCGWPGGQLCLAAWAGVDKRWIKGFKFLIERVLIPHGAKDAAVEPSLPSFALGKVASFSTPWPGLSPSRSLLLSADFIHRSRQVISSGNASDFTQNSAKTGTSSEFWGYHQDFSLPQPLVTEKRLRNLW